MSDPVSSTTHSSYPGTESRSPAWRRPEWILWAAILLCSCVATLVRLGNLDALLDRLSGPHWWAELIWWNTLVPLAVVAFATVGALIVSRQPENRTGWYALALAGMVAFHEVVWQFAVSAVYLQPGALPFAGLADWLASLVPPAILVLMFAIMLAHFPDGRLVSPRWRWLIWIAGVIALLNAAIGSYEAITGTATDIVRPSALTLGRNIGVSFWIHSLVEFAAAGAALLSTLSVFRRWRGASGLQRNQLKWLGYVGGLIGTSLLAWMTIVTLTGDSYWSLALLSINLMLFTIGVPLAIGVAILRYGLFDIDVVINRTLVYGALTIVVGTGYTLCVLSLQAVFGRFLGGQDPAIVITTLLAVVAIKPLRDRIQLTVDRRFFRRKFDAVNTLAALESSFRDEFDVNRLQSGVERVLNETLQPAHVSIWITEPAGMSDVLDREGPKDS